MIEIKKAFENLSSDEHHALLDAPVWMSLMAAYEADGKVSENEKADAVKLAHLRTFTSPKSLREYYEQVDSHFAERFEKLDKRLPKGDLDRKSYLTTQVKNAHKILARLDPDVAMALEESLESFYEHVFKADKSFFQYFALPIISNRLDKQSGHFDFGKD